MAGSKLRSARSSLDQGDFRRSLSFCQAGRVAQFLKDETRHSTRRSWFWWFETRHWPVEGVNPNVTSRFRSGWSVPTGLRFAWTPLFYTLFFCTVLSYTACFGWMNPLNKDKVIVDGLVLSQKDNEWMAEIFFLIKKIYLNEWLVFVYLCCGFWSYVLLYFYIFCVFRGET